MVHALPADLSASRRKVRRIVPLVDDAGGKKGEAGRARRLTSEVMEGRQNTC